MSRGLQKIYPVNLRILNACGKFFTSKYFYLICGFSPWPQNCLWEGRRKVNIIYYTLERWRKGASQRQNLDETQEKWGWTCARISHHGCSALQKGCACCLLVARHQAGRLCASPILSIWPLGKAGQEAQQVPSSQLHPSADCHASLQGRQGLHRLAPQEHSTIPLSPLQFTKPSFPMPLLAQFRLKKSLRNGQACLLSLGMFI